MRIYGLFDGHKLVGSPVVAAGDEGFENQMVSVFMAAPVDFYKSLTARLLCDVHDDGSVSPADSGDTDYYEADIYSIIRAAVVKFEKGMKEDG